MNDLCQKIDEAKRRLPLPELMAREGLSEHAKKSAHCPFHDDEHKSFSVFKGDDGFWHWKCFAGCGEGDEIEFLLKHFGIARPGAIKSYLEMAGFPTRALPKSHEYPKSRKSREFPESPGSHGSPQFPVSPVYPMSN
jgi:DNA primase